MAVTRPDALRWTLGLAGGLGALIVAGWLVLAWSFYDQPVSTPAPSDRFVTAGGIRMRYREVGAGHPTIILLHGFGGRIESWGSVPDSIGCGRVVVFDLPGFGASGRPNVSYDLDSQRRRVLSAMDRLGIDRAVFAGASMGGAVAALLAARSPTRVAGLALFAPSGLMKDLRLPGVAGWIQSAPIPATVARWLARVPGFGVLFPLNLARQSLTLTASYDDAYAAALDSIRAPTVLVWSAGDTRVAMAASTAYVQRIRGARLVTAPDSLGHDLLRDAGMAARTICDVAARGIDVER